MCTFLTVKKNLLQQQQHQSVPSFYEVYFLIRIRGMLAASLWLGRQFEVVAFAHYEAK